MRARSLTALATALLTGFSLNVGPAYADPPPTPVHVSPSASLPGVNTAVAVADQPVIVIMKNQHQNVPATVAAAAGRARVLAAEQNPVITDLQRTGAKRIHSFKLLSSVSATVSVAEKNRLAADPAVAQVVPDVSFAIRRPLTQAAPTSVTTCRPGQDGVELDPEALGVIHADSTDPTMQTARRLGITGKGVTVAYLAEGIDPNNPDFLRADGSHVFTDYQDFTGEGAPTTSSGGEAILDASSIAAQGRSIFQIGSCKFRVAGAATGASLVGLKVFPNGSLAATSSELLQAIDYAVTVDHVDVLNQSFGYNPLPDTTVDLIRQADEAATQAGTTVVVSTGDAGPTNTFGSPSSDPAVISAAATTTFRVYAQADIANFREIGATGFVDNNISALSSGGFSAGLKSPDLAAPGDLNLTLDNPGPGRYGVGISGGTSEAAPLISATAALVIQAYRTTHGGQSPAPALVKQLITSTTDDLGHPGNQQGTGLLDSYQAVKAALSVKTPAGAPTAQGGTLLTSTDQLTATAAPGSVQRFPLTVTNNGARTQTVQLHGRVLGADRTVADRTVILGATTGTHFNGLDVQTVKFTVPVGQSRLKVQIAAPSNDFLDLTLIDPLGQLEAYSLPQGVGNHGAVEVRYPGFGTWTAVITDAPPAQGGYAGPVQLHAEVATYQPFGAIQPSTVTLAPGASQRVTVAVSTPKSPGDLSAALELDAPFGARTSIPINLRSLVPLGAHRTGQFSTAVTGGNGRGGSPGVTEFYQFDVPAGQKALDVQTTESARAVNNYDLYLVDPSGETVGHAANQLVVGKSGSTPVTVTERGARTHVLDPPSGRWLLVAAFPNPVTGTALSTTFEGAIRLAPITPGVSGLPNAPSAHLAAGRPHVAKVTIRNDGTAPETYFVDARLPRSTTITLPPYKNATNLALPLTTAVPTPQWIVPTQTTLLTAQAQATAPVTFDWAPYTGYLGGDLNGDPDLGATTTGNTASGSWSGAPVTSGDWMIDPALIGPFGTTPTAGATANLALAATTKAFDTATTSTTGDFWASGAGVSVGFTPVIVQPGRSTTIYVTITPSGRAGSVVKGTLYLDDLSSLSPFGEPVPAGDELAAIPYSYTIG